MASFLAATQGIGFAITAHDMASKTLLRTNTLVKTLGATANKAGLTMAKGFAGAVGSMAVLGAGMAGIQTLFSTTKEAATFEQAMERVGIVTRATGAQFEALSDEARRLGLETEFTSTQVAEAMQMLAQAGFSAKDIADDLTATVLDLTSAAGGMITTAQAASTVAVAYKMFRDELTGARQAADMMTRATQMSLLQFDELQRAFAGLSGEAKTFEMGFRESLALITAAKDFGYSAAGGANALRIAMRNVISNNQELLDITGGTVSVFNKAGDGYRSFIDVIDDLDKHWKKTGASVEQRTEDIIKVFTKRGLRGLSIALKGTFVTATGEFKTGIEALRARIAELEDSEDAVMTAAQRMRETLVGTFQRIGGSLKNMLILIGQHITPAVTKLAEKFFDLTVQVNYFISSHKGLTKIGVALTALSSAFLVLAGAIGTVASGLVILVAMLKMAGLWEVIVTGYTRTLEIVTAWYNSVLMMQAAGTSKLSMALMGLAKIIPINTAATKLHTLAAEVNIGTVTTWTAVQQALNIVLAETWALIWPVVAILAAATAGIYLFVKGWKMLDQGLKEGNAKLIILGWTLKKLGMMIFVPLQTVEFGIKVFQRFKKAVQGVKAFLDPFFVGLKKYKETVAPLYAVFAALQELLENGFRIRESTAKKLENMGLLGIFVKIGTMLKWAHKFGAALSEVFSKAKEFRNKVFGLFMDTRRAGAKSLFGNFGKALISAWRFAMGEITFDEFNERIKTLAENVASDMRRYMREFYVKLLTMKPTDWRAIADKILKALGAMLVIIFKVIPNITLALVGALIIIGLQLGWALLKGLGQGIWDARGIIWNSIKRLFMWLLQSIFNLNPVVLLYRGMMSGLESADRTKRGVGVRQENEVALEKLNRRLGNQGVATHVTLEVDKRVLADVMVDEQGTQQNMAGTRLAPGPGGRTGTGR